MSIYTDTWVSMGQETEKERRMRDFAGYIVDEKLLAARRSMRSCCIACRRIGGWRSATG